MESLTFIQKKIAKILNANDELIIFDIGACEGEDSFKYARQFPSAKIYLFEPLPSNIEILKQKIATADNKNLYLNELGLSNYLGKGEFYISGGKPSDDYKGEWNKSSSLLKPNKEILNKKYSWLKFNKKIEIDITTLNKFCNENKITSIDFVHMDVQGAEYLVLQGAGSILPKIKMIWLEVENEEYYEKQKLGNDIFKFLKEKSFVRVINTSKGKSEGDSLYLNTKYISQFSFYIKTFFK